MRLKHGILVAGLLAVCAGIGGAFMNGTGRGWLRPAKIQIEAGALGRIRLETPLSSERNHQGDAVAATLPEAVVVHDTVALPAGTRVVGEVNSIESTGRMKNKASIGIRFDRLQPPAGAEISIVSDPLFYRAGGEGTRDAELIGGGTVVGGVIGGLTGSVLKGAVIGAAAGTGAALAARGDPVTLRAGRLLPLRLREGVQIQLPRNVEVRRPSGRS
jgi:hypothetical protein